MFSVLMLYLIIYKKSNLSDNCDDCIVLLCLYEIAFMTHQRVPQTLFHHLRYGFV